MPHELIPAWHGFDGAQGAPAVHAKPTPPPQTKFVPQIVPSAIGDPVSEQTTAPVVHVTLPA